MAQPAAAGSATNRDLSAIIKPVVSVVDAVRTSAGGNVNGTGVDLRGYEGACVFVTIGAAGDTFSVSVTQTWSLQDSPDNAAWTNVIAAAVIDPDSILTTATLVINANSQGSNVYRFGYVGGTAGQRYLRVVLTLAGTQTNGTPCSANIVKGFARVNVATM